MSSYFAVPFWNGIVLQLASSQPALQHAVAGIGALYETLNEVAIHNGQPLSQYGVLQRQLALRQSNKAIKLLRSAKPADLNLETLLVACILFICQENMFGEWFSVLYHLEAGLGLLKGHKRKDRKVPLALSPDMIEEHIMPVIARLESQYTMLHPSTPEYRTFYLPPADAEFPVFQFPVEFNNLIEANGCFERLNRHIYYQYACQTRGKTHEPLVHAELIPLGLRQLQQWAVLFEGFIRTQSKSPSDAELRAIAYLRVHHHFSRILVQTLPFNDEMVMDRYTEDFRTIIVHAAEFIRLTVKASNSGTLTSVFAIEPHIVRTLHMVGIHCRHPSIRREAVRLLREYDRQEGPFGSLISAAVSERCRVIEERGLGEVKYCSEIPECNRIRLVAGTISGLPNSSRSVCLETPVSACANARSVLRSLLLKPLKMKTSAWVLSHWNMFELPMTVKGLCITTRFLGCLPTPICSIGCRR